MVQSFVVSCVVLGTASVAYARHPIVAQAITLSDEADFDGALAAFRRAEQASDLERDDLVEIYARRGALLIAMGDETSARADLRRLAALQPDYAFDAATPPPVLAAFDEERTRTRALAIDVDTTVLGGTTRFLVSVQGDPGGLVRDVRLSVRAMGTSTWTHVAASSYEAAGTGFELHAEALGAGGVVVATHASETEPDRVGVPSAAIAAAVAPVESSADPTWWIVGGIGGAVLVAGVIVIAVVATSGSSDQTAFAPPVVRNP